MDGFQTAVDQSTAVQAAEQTQLAADVLRRRGQVAVVPVRQQAPAPERGPLQRDGLGRELRRCGTERGW